MLRHMIKMAWFDANCEDKPIPGVTNLDEITEEQQQKRLEERMYWKQQAATQTEILDSYIDKLAKDAKTKEKLKAPIYATQHNETKWGSFLIHSHIVYKIDNELKDGIPRAIIDNAVNKKGAFKKMAETVEQENQRKAQYFQFLHAKAKARNVR